MEFYENKKGMVIFFGYLAKRRQYDALTFPKVRSIIFIDVLNFYPVVVRFGKINALCAFRSFTQFPEGFFFYDAFAIFSFMHLAMRSEKSRMIRWISSWLLSLYASSDI